MLAVTGLAFNIHTHRVQKKRELLNLFQSGIVKKGKKKVFKQQQKKNNLHAFAYLLNDDCQKRF